MENICELLPIGGLVRLFMIIDIVEGSLELLVSVIVNFLVGANKEQVIPVNPVHVTPVKSKLEGMSS